MARSRYWFPAKRFGWGWGLPVTWQGWAVFAAYFVVLGAGAWLFPPHVAQNGFIAWALADTAVLVLVCWLKGEPPSWRWG